ncbi:MAG TPA: hypothetical protein VKR06_07065 [Ktedonosporobacter sp.]|nr:hypothetical protein [Ktedonosporobacter sp.]
MGSEMSEEVLGQEAIQLDNVVGKQHIVQTIQIGMSKAIGRLQAWHYLTLLFSAFWILFAIIMITSEFFFLVVLIILALISFLVTLLAWAYQNNI